MSWGSCWCRDRSTCGRTTRKATARYDHTETITQRPSHRAQTPDQLWRILLFPPLHVKFPLKNLLGSLLFNYLSPALKVITAPCFQVKDLARFKPMQRHLFLYDKMLLFCKKREETTDGHEKTPSYSFKHSLKVRNWRCCWVCYDFETLTFIQPHRFYTALCCCYRRNTF